MTSPTDAFEYATLIRFFIIVFGAVLVVYLITARRRLKRYIRPRKDRLPPRLWFYSSLVDMELGVAPNTAKHLEKLFYTFLQREYNLPDIRPETAFSLVKERESDASRIDLYGEIYNEIESLKHMPAGSVIEYVRRLKPAFHEGVAAQTSTSRDCNTC